MHFSVPTSPERTRIKSKAGTKVCKQKTTEQQPRCQKSPLGRKDAGEDLGLHARTWERDDSDEEQTKILTMKY